jgi:hypothetical protein
MSDDNKIVPFTPPPMFASEGGACADTEPPAGPTEPDVDLFDMIVRQLFTDAAMVTAPGAIDPRWPVLIAQAYREGIAQMVRQAPGGVLMRWEHGSLGIYALSAPQPGPVLSSDPQ